MASSSAVVPNAQVRLLSSTGAVLATSTTDSSGNYSFTRLLAGSGYRVEFGPTTQGAANAATNASVTTNRSVTANATTTVNGVYALLRTNILTGRATYGQSVSVTPEPNDSTGTQTYASFTKAATCVIDPSDNQCKATVVISGQGSWTANSTTGTISFTPIAGYSGTTTAVAYRLTETSSSNTTWNYASAVIDAPVVTTTTTIPVATSSVSVPSSSTARAASTGVLVTQVVVPSAGRVIQTGTVVVGGVRIVAVSCVPVSVTRSRTISARCTLTSAARRALRQSGISVSMTTRFTARDGSVHTTKTTIKLKKLAILPVTR
jgi:CshA-type fibril repeat protein